jgi:hypothetical protein
MIIFDLKCVAGGHVFEAWFGSSEDFEAQRASGLVACPICGSGEVDKAPMAPKVCGADRDEGPPAEAVKSAMSELAAAQRKMLESSEHVGDRFPDEARAIHLGEAEQRAIHGLASPEDAESLRDEGIPIRPLPFPVRDPGEEN